MNEYDISVNNDYYNVEKNADGWLYWCGGGLDVCKQYMNGPCQQ